MHPLVFELVKAQYLQEFGRMFGSFVLRGESRKGGLLRAAMARGYGMPWLYETEGEYAVWLASRI